ncbi:MAG: hypothetical protein ABI778_04370 [Ignavibacteriota bacterium]
MRTKLTIKAELEHNEFLGTSDQDNISSFTRSAIEDIIDGSQDYKVLSINVTPVALSTDEQEAEYKDL